MASDAQRALVAGIQCNARDEAFRISVIDARSLISEHAALERERDKLRARVGDLEKRLAALIAHIDEMPNPHENPMRHYWNRMQAWKSEAWAPLEEEDSDAD